PIAACECDEIAAIRGTIHRKPHGKFHHAAIQFVI
ncbi:MAG: hypothetical protein QOG83_3667, partial [Alphaproteobacteria bacterium]|nr:hypothetical protein [Alphaproteobacteria bacterium]